MFITDWCIQSKCSDEQVQCKSQWTIFVCWRRTLHTGRPRLALPGTSQQSLSIQIRPLSKCTSCLGFYFLGQANRCCWPPQNLDRKSWWRYLCNIVNFDKIKIDRTFDEVIFVRLKDPDQVSRGWLSVHAELPSLVKSDHFRWPKVAPVLVPNPVVWTWLVRCCEISKKRILLAEQLSNFSIFIEC